MIGKKSARRFFNRYRSKLAHIFPRFAPAGYVYFLRVLIGSLDLMRQLLLAAKYVMFTTLN